MRHLANDKFVLHYQPIMDVSQNRFVAAEALIRWQSPERVFVSPGEFIPLAEDTGLIVPISEWVLFTACEEAVSWPTETTVSVNLSVRQFQRQNVLALVVRALEKSGLPAERLNLEITESLLISDDESVLKTLHELRGLGVKLSIDDFGTGYSSLSYLKCFPITHLKIDRTFIMDVTTDVESAALVEVILSMAGSLGLTVTAEGVENTEQVEFLKARSCDRIQGFYFSRPQPKEALNWTE